MNPRPLNVLIIEDNKFEAEILSGIIGKLGHFSFDVADYESARSAIIAMQFQVVTIDIQLQGPMTGVDIVFRLLREFDRSQFNPQLVVITSQRLSAVEKQELLDKGISRVIQKPIDHADLEAVF